MIDRYVAVIDRARRRYGYVERLEADRSIHVTLARYGLGVTDCDYMFIGNERPSDLGPLPIFNPDWRDIKTFDDALEVCERTSEKIHDTWLACRHGWLPCKSWLIYQMVRYALGEKSGGEWVPRIYVTPDKLDGRESLGSVTLKKDGVTMNLYKCPPLRDKVNGIAVTQRFMGDKWDAFKDDNPFAFNDGYGLSSEEKADHVCRYFHRELFNSLYWNVDYAWVEDE